MQHLLFAREFSYHLHCKKIDKNWRIFVNLPENIWDKNSLNCFHFTLQNSMVDLRKLIKTGEFLLIYQRMNIVWDKNLLFSEIFPQKIFLYFTKFYGRFKKIDKNWRIQKILWLILVKTREYRQQIGNLFFWHPLAQSRPPSVSKQS